MARQAGNTFKRKVSFLDENFDEKTDFAEGTIASAKTLVEATSMLGDETEVLKALNQVLRERQISAAMAAKSGGIEIRYVAGFIKPMRNMEPFNTIESEKEQTKAILAQVKTVPFLLNGLKSYCAIRAKDDAEGVSEDE